LQYVQSYGISIDGQDDGKYIDEYLQIGGVYIIIVLLYEEWTESGRKTKLTQYPVFIEIVILLNILAMKTVFDFLPFRHYI
jgi:hypothetical protein